MHVCTVCHEETWPHSELCWYGESLHSHVPALCCEGCECQAVENAHPEEFSDLEEAA